MRSEKTDRANLTIRPFGMEDYRAIIDLWEMARLPYKPRGRDSPEKIEKELRGPNAVFLVAEMDDQLVGCVFATHDGRKGWINRLAVAPQVRRQGIATRLVEEAESHLGRLGIEIVACLIEDGNEDSKRFFEYSGYRRFHGISYFTKKSHPDV
jgi:ribosomal protein S18 acetylase RimI-like enzyme